MVRVLTIACYCPTLFADIYIYIFASTIALAPTIENTDTIPYKQSLVIRYEYIYSSAVNVYEALIQAF